MSPLPGFVAAPEGPAALAVAPAGAVSTRCGPARLHSWGVPAVAGTWVLSRVTRTAAGPVGAREIASSHADASASGRMEPPFAVAFGDDDGVAMVADAMGLRQLYHSRADAGGLPVLSTSALLAGRVRRAPLDLDAVAVQAHLGWQLGQRTLFAGIEKMEPGVAVHLGVEGVRIGRPVRAGAEPISLETAVREAASLLRRSLEALLDEHPDAVLQLTGGQDSRLLLSAIPKTRRRGLRAMTLAVANSQDVAVASRIAETYGLDHDVRDLPDLGTLDPAEAWDACLLASIHLDGMADPVALAALSIAEDRFDQGVRISGLGGEVARGFYYVGRVRERSYGDRDARRLAEWRMFANESVEQGALEPGFDAWGRATAFAAVAAALRRGGDEWFRATDELYLRDRMQRWAGITETAVGWRRTVLNPMLDEGFLDIAMRLRPADKAHSRFLALLQLELDPELGTVPLEGRPAPRHYAHPGTAARASQAASSGRKAVRKILQRARRGARPPVGGVALAERVLEHWRAHPEVLTPVAESGLMRAEWVEAMLTRIIEPRPSSIAFVTNLTTALHWSKSGASEFAG